MVGGGGEKRVKRRTFSFTPFHFRAVFPHISGVAYVHGKYNLVDTRRAVPSFTPAIFATLGTRK